jgi:hypothetical protein
MGTLGGAGGTPMSIHFLPPPEGGGPCHRRGVAHLFGEAGRRVGSCLGLELQDSPGLHSQGHPRLRVPGLVQGLHSQAGLQRKGGLGSQGVDGWLEKDMDMGVGGGGGGQSTVEPDTHPRRSWGWRMPLFETLPHLLRQPWAPPTPLSAPAQLRGGMGQGWPGPEQQGRRLCLCLCSRPQRQPPQWSTALGLGPGSRCLHQQVRSR